MIAWWEHGDLNEDDQHEMEDILENKNHGSTCMHDDKDFDDDSDEEWEEENIWDTESDEDERRERE